MGLSPSKNRTRGVGATLQALLSGARTPTVVVEPRLHFTCKSQILDCAVRNERLLPMPRFDVGQTQRACNVHFGWPVVFAMSTARARNLTNVRSVSTLQARMSGGIL